VRRMDAALEPTGMIALATSLWLALRAAFAVRIGNPADSSRRVPGCASARACQRRSTLYHALARKVARHSLESSD